MPPRTSSLKVGSDRRERVLLRAADIDVLSARTWRALLVGNNLSVYLCSDNGDAIREFAHGLGPRVLPRPGFVSNYVAPADATFLDFFALARAGTIVASPRWSSFSFTACLIGGYPCEYRLTMPDGAQLQHVHRSGFAAAVRPRLLHVVGCHCNKLGSNLSMPARWLAAFDRSGAVITNACHGRRWPDRPRRKWWR